MTVNPNYFMLDKSIQEELRLTFFLYDKNIEIFNDIVGKYIIGEKLSDEIIMNLNKEDLEKYKNIKMELVHL